MHHVRLELPQSAAHLSVECEADRKVTDDYGYGKRDRDHLDGLVLVAEQGEDSLVVERRPQLLEGHATSVG